jgi:hypothetical protein
VLLVCLLGPSPGRAQTNDPPPFEEVLRVLRAHLPGVTEAELNRAALQGLLDGFQPRVLLTTNAPPAPLPAVLISRTGLYDRAFGYIRLAGCAPGLPAEFDRVREEVRGTNQLKGWVLDLRFAHGEDYRAAAAVADRFLAQARPLMSWGEESVRSTEKTNAIELPLAVLINHDTAGAAEALAEALRTTGAALLVGQATAGQAYVFREFELANQQRLRVATTAVRIGEDLTLNARVAPDVEVGVNADAEKAWFADPFKALRSSGAASGEPGEGGLSGAQTNRGRPRMNEAELVRRQRDRGTAPGPEGTGLAPSDGGRSGETLVQDPALRRALELLRALALVGRPRAS